MAARVARGLLGEGRNTWGRESPDYWSTDDARAFRGACPAEGLCGHNLWFNPASGSYSRTCSNRTCPWDIAGTPEGPPATSPEAPRTHLDERFSGLEIEE